MPARPQQPETHRLPSPKRASPVLASQLDYAPQAACSQPQPHIITP
ncbi:hypothetical protein GCWU000324_01278 [Kingella oralis ATCC 51147]|uniref:Uncharacterized protein n=1 Tax=Kingella oralis ATCC 51147 TaxID=629741 RepID=C4GGL0_9NEIS|nr:hypothetical protein GCWU000324_01278 [Kingella oralis ATCC 51147]